MKHEPLFNSTHAAISFALNFQGRPEISFTNRAWKSTEWPGDVPRGQSNGLSGVDGAGQAGLIRRMLQSLGELHEAILFAEIAPRWEDCPCNSLCCSGKVMCQEWKDAIAWISDDVRVNVLDGHKTDHKLRRSIVEVAFKVLHKNVDIAKWNNVDRGSVGVMIAKVKKYIDGESCKAWAGADRALCSLVSDEAYA